MKPSPKIQDLRAEQSHRDRGRRRLRRCLVAIGVVVLLVLFGFFGLPPIIKAQAVKHLSAALGREVTIERVRINPLVLSVAVEGLAIKDRDAGPFVGWKRLYVNFDSWSLFTGEWRFQEIELNGFSSRVVLHKDGTFNFSDLIPAPAASTPPAAPSTPARPVRIGKLTIISAAFDFTDEGRPAPFSTEVAPLSFTIEDFRTLDGPGAPYAFAATTEAGESFDWRGTLSVNPLRSTGEFSIGKLALKKYAPYYADRMRADILDGTLDIAAHYTIDLTEGARVLGLNNGVIKLGNLQVAERGVSSPAIELPALTITGISADGVKPSAGIQRISLDQAHLRIRRDAGGALNLLTMLTPEKIPAAPATTAAAPAPSAPVALPDVKLDEFAITGLLVDFEDRTTPTPAKNTIEKLDLSVKHLSLSEAAAPVAINLAVVLASGGELAVEGSAVREPLAANLLVKATALSLSGFTPYVEPFLNLRLASGTVSLSGKAGVAGSAATFQGDVSVDQFAALDGAQAEDFAKFASLAIRGLDVTTEPLAAKIAEINLVDPAGRFVINADKSTNFATVLRASAATPASKPASGGPPAKTKTGAPAAGPSPAWSLGKFTLTNGSFALTDRSIKPAVQTALNQLSGTVTGLSSADLQRGDVDFHGKVDGIGSIAITGKLNARAVTPAPNAATDFVIDARSIDLSPLSPYIGAYAGYELARGSLTLDVKSHLAQRKIDSANVITLNQFTLGQATNSPEATKLPVRLGVALLKDIDGNIVIDVPVKGSLDDPNFKIGRVVLRVIVNLLTKAAVSPFSLIGAMFGGGGDELAYQEFAPGEVNPLPAEAAKIETLRKALKARPALNLDITGSFDAAADQDALRQQQLTGQLRVKLWEERRVQDPATLPPEQIELSPQDEARLVAGLFAEKFPAGVVVKPDGSTMAVPVPKSEARAERPEPRAYHRGQPILRPVFEPKPAPRSIVPPSSIVNVSKDMQVQGISTAPTLADMRRLLAADLVVTDDDLRQLATARAQQVRTLLESGQIAPERLFLTPVPVQPKGARVLLQLK
ncbi:MAG: DUF748 domain-containing protein [Verrucomicrobia bacterium]|nr:DUF748 domain-containing protein [Verrucomicrobiota bacterium]